MAKSLDILSCIDDDIGRQAFRERVPLSQVKARIDLTDPRTHALIAGYLDEARCELEKINHLIQS